MSSLLGIGRIIMLQYDVVRALRVASLNTSRQRYEGRRLTADGGCFVCGESILGFEVEDDGKLSVPIPEIVQNVQLGAGN